MTNMAEPAPEAWAAAVIEEERLADADDAVRADAYGLLAALLAGPPSAELIDALRRIDRVEVHADSDLAVAWETLRLAAERAELEEVDDEYHALFIGVGRGELVPFASWYLTGFLMDKPLALLRRDLADLGFERGEDVREPEDHVAALCETMSMVIAAAGEIPFETQQRFFEEHVAPWMGTFFRDLEQANAARFYRAVAQFGARFIEFEKQYLRMPA